MQYFDQLHIIIIIIIMINIIITIIKDDTAGCASPVRCDKGFLNPIPMMHI